ELADLADDDLGPFDRAFHRLRLGLLAAETALLRLGPAPALGVLAELRRSAPCNGHLGRRVDALEVSALIAAGSIAPARSLVDATERRSSTSSGHCPSTASTRRSTRRSGAGRPRSSTAIWCSNRSRPGSRACSSCSPPT